EAAYINESEFVSGVAQDSDALKISYHNLRDFKTVKDIHAIEEILEAIEVNIDAIETNINQIEAKITQIESDIDAINQTYLPLDGSKAMKGDLNLDIYKLSKLDTKESYGANLRAADFNFGHSNRRGLLHPGDYLGRAFVDSSSQDKTSLSINYQSDWSTTNIGGKVHLKDVDPSVVDFMASESSDNSLLLMDTTNQILKSNNLLNSLLSRITKLEKQPATNVPIGMVAIWGKPAPFPEGWEEYVPLRGKMPVGLNIDEIEFNTLDKTGGTKSSNVSAAIPASGYGFSQNTSNGTSGKLIISSGREEDSENLESIAIVSTTPYINFSVNNLNPYRVVQFIEYKGVLSDKTPPTKPNLIISNTGTTTISLSWTASTDNVAVTNYILYRSGALPIQLGNVLAYNVSELSPGTAYSFYITATDAAGNSSTSNTVNETTKSIVEPTIPTILTAVLSGVNRIELSWKISTNNGSGVVYEIYRKENYPDAIFLSIHQTTETYYTDRGINSDFNYTYYIVSLDDDGKPTSHSTNAVEVKGDPNIKDE
ncbi:MAG: fibronectin type III domain-containing protein, partial [Flavobacterium sp.]